MGIVNEDSKLQRTSINQTPSGPDHPPFLFDFLGGQVDAERRGVVIRSNADEGHPAERLCLGSQVASEGQWKASSLRWASKKRADGLIMSVYTVTRKARVSK